MKKIISSKVKNKSFECPSCGNHTLYCVNHDVYRISDVDYHDNFVCDECGDEFVSEPQYNGGILFVNNVNNVNSSIQCSDNFNHVIGTGYQYYKDGTSYGIEDNDGNFIADGFETVEDVEEYIDKLTKSKKQVNSAKKIYDTPKESKSNKYEYRNTCIFNRVKYVIYFTSEVGNDSACVYAIRPYDTSDYTTAYLKNQEIKYIRNNKVIDTETFMIDSEDADIHNEDLDEAIDRMIEHISQLDEDISPKVINDSSDLSNKQKDISSAIEIDPDVRDESEVIREQCYEAAIAYLVDFGFSRDEAKDYVAVDATFDQDFGNKYLVLELRAEVNYDGLVEIMNEVDPIVSHYDQDAYFDAAEPGVAVCWISCGKIKAIISSISIEGMYQEDLDNFFTKDDVTELADNVLSKLQDLLPEFDLSVVDFYETAPNVITIEISVSDEEKGFDPVVSDTKKIDMRKIKKPSDINTYSDVFAKNLYDKIQEEMKASQFYSSEEIDKKDETILSWLDSPSPDDYPEPEEEEIDDEFDIYLDNCQLTVTEDGSMYSINGDNLTFIYDKDGNIFEDDWDQEYDSDDLYDQILDEISEQVEEDGVYMLSGKATIKTTIRRNIYHHYLDDPEYDTLDGGIVHNTYDDPEYTDIDYSVDSIELKDFEADKI